MRAINARSVAVFAPAKLNLFLSVGKKRGDGFHDLVSLTAMLQFGDSLWITTREDENEDSLSCQAEGVEELPECGPDNLILRAAREYRDRRKIPFGLHFHLIKRIPMGAGLGGGSSDAAAVLRGLNTLVEKPIGIDRLRRMAARIGSDVPLFLQSRAAVIRGRGERVDDLEAPVRARLAGRRVLVFKPGFTVRTAWAYARLDADDRPDDTGGPTGAIASLSRWLDSNDPVEAIVENTFRGILCRKFPAYPVLLKRLETDFGLTCGISGSGSACFAVLPDDFEKNEAGKAIADAWGPGLFMVESRLS